MTQAADQLERVLSARYDGVRFGRYNCRRIAGSERYSQHSWSNARDIYAPEDHDHPSAFIAEVIEWCEANEDALSIRLILWQVSGHYGHAHIDFWPTGYATPPCDMGVSTFQYSDGHRVFIRDPMPENGFYEEEGDELMPVQQWHQLIDALFEARPEEFRGSADYWKGLDPEDYEWADFFGALVEVLES